MMTDQLARPGKARRHARIPASARAAAALAALAATASLVTVLAGCGRRTEPAASAAGRQIEAEITTAARAQVPVVVSAPGGVEALTQVQVSTRMMGWVRRVHVAEGEAVRAGTPLVTIDDTDLKAKLAQVEAGIAEARAVVENATRLAARFQQLHAEKAVSRQQLDDVLTGRARAEAGLATAQAAREEVAVHLRYLEITAPVGGVIVRKLVDPGAMAAPGQPLLVLEQVDRMKIVAHLSEQDVGAVAAGDTVTIEVTSLPGATLRAPLARVIAAANPGSRTYDIEAYVDNAGGRLKSGMFARVLVPIGRREAVVVPAESIVERGQLRGVFVVDEDGVAHLRWVRLGRPQPGGVEVLAGLDGGETIVRRSAQPLVGGDRVVRKDG